MYVISMGKSPLMVQVPNLLTLLVFLTVVMYKYFRCVCEYASRRRITCKLTPNGGLELNTQYDIEISFSKKKLNFSRQRDTFQHISINEEFLLFVQAFGSAETSLVTGAAIWTRYGQYTLV
jgi:hypothetical protein